MNTTRLDILSLIAACLLFVQVPARAQQPAAGDAAATAEDPVDTIEDVPRGGRLAMYKAQEAIKKDDTAKAIEVLEKFVSGHPDDDHFLVRFQLGAYLQRGGRNDDALVQYKKVVAMEPRFAQGWLNLGELAYNLEDYPLAAHAIMTGYDLSDEKSAHLLYYAAVAHILDHKPAEAAPLLADLVSGDHGDPKMEWFRALISVYLELEDTAHGNATVTSMLQHFGDDPAAWLLAFQFSAASGDYRRAAVALTVTGYLRPLTHEEEMQLGDLYTAVGVPAVAGNYYEAALADGTGDAAEYERLSSAYVASYQPERALDTIKRALEDQPTVRLYSLLGDLYYLQQDNRNAYDAYKQCVALDESYGRAYLMMGYCALELGETADAVSKLGRALDFPDFAESAQQLLDYANR